jgi:hypothetical protein
VFITDEMLWQNTSFRQARLAQWCDLCSYMARTAIFYVGENPLPHLRPLGPVSRRTEFYTLRPDAEAVVRAVEALCGSYFVAEAVVAVRGELGRKIWTDLKTRIGHVTLDDWGCRPRESARLEVADMWIWEEERGDSQKGRPLSTTALRYPPPGFERNRAPRPNAPILIAQCGSDKVNQIGLDFLLRHDKFKARKVISVDLASEDLGSSSSFVNLQKLEPPEAVIALGSDRRGAEISRCLAGFWGARFTWVANDGFPIYTDDGGAPNLCWTFGELADCLATADRQGPGTTEHSADGGWSTYWRLVSRRKHPDASPVADDR